MSVLRPNQVQQFINLPPENISGVLVYGPNDGRIGEICDGIVKSVIGSTDDPFNLVNLNDSQLKESPGLLRDEMLALSFTGGRKIVWIKDPGPAFTRQLSGFFDESLGNNLLVVQAGQLKRSAAVVKIFEKSQKTVCVACYEDTIKDLSAFVVQRVNAHNKTIDPATVNFLIESIGLNRSLVLSEIEKLVNFCADSEQITASDVEALAGDSLSGSIDELCDLSLIGDTRGCIGKFQSLIDSGSPAAQILNVLSMNLTKLQELRIAMDKGQSADNVIKSARPPIFFKRQMIVKHQLQNWQGSTLNQALTIVFQAILLTRKSPEIADSICERALISLSKKAIAGRR